MLQRSGTGGRLAYAAAAAGPVYVGTAWAGPALFGLAGLDYAPSPGFLRGHSVAYMLALAALSLPALLLLAWAARRHRTEGGPPLVGERWSVLLAAAGASALCGVLLDAARLWPWTWQRPGASTAFAEALVQHRLWPAIGILLLVSGVVNPLIEEVVFRFGLLQTLHRWSGSGVFAVLASSLLFTLAHLGPPFRPSPSALYHAAWIFLFSLVLGTVALRRSGRIGIPWALHAGRNLAELLLLFAWLA